uniref:Regulator of G protein signaling 19 n=1 Tax=Equus asinus TaxID=9793 RepID=A0A8C4PVR8_EQUAS
VSALPARGAEDGGPASPRPGPRGRAGRELRESAPGSAPRALPPRGPRGPWAAAGLEPAPRAWGRGRWNRVPLFLQRKAWGSDCSKGGPEEPRFPRLQAWWGGAEAGHPVRPRPHPFGSGSGSALRVAWEALRPQPQPIEGSRRRPPSRTPQEFLLPSDLSPCCCSARPFGSQGGAQSEPGPFRPHLPWGRWNEERRRAWRASRESKLQPLPSCEACATPSPEEVRSWAQSFDKLMHSAAGRTVFREFLRTEYSEENMLFWLACEELKAEANQHVVDEKARLIYEDYVSILSPKEVSLDSRVREGINKKMQEPSAHTFDDAQLQIYTLMHRDSYPRFLSSPTYRALLLRGGSQSSNEA